MQVDPLWPLIAAWVGAGASWLAFLLALFGRRQDKKECIWWDYTRLADEREKMWSALREAYNRWKEPYTSAPSELDALVRTVGLPPDVLSRKGRPLVQWPIENETSLSPDQRLLWDFAKAVYPPRQQRQGNLIDHSIISDSLRDDFHKSRNHLARFWDVSGRTVSIRVLAKRYQSAKLDFLILSWLDIALKQWTQDQGEGNQVLYRLASRANYA